MPAKFDENKKRVLVAFYQFIRESDGTVWLEANDIEPYCHSSLSRSFIQLILQTLESSGDLEGEEDKSGRYVRFTLTAKGIGQAEKWAGELGLWEGFDTMRTSVNEVVDLENVDTEAAKEALDGLSAALESGNDVGNLTPDEVQSAIVEVSALRGMLDGAKIRAGTMATQARQTLRFITEQAGKSVIGELSKKALTLILTLLGYGN